MQHRADGVRRVLRGDRAPAGCSRPAPAPGTRPGPVPSQPAVRIRRAAGPVYRAAGGRLPGRPVAQRAAAKRLLAAAARPAHRRRRAGRILAVPVRRDGGPAQAGAPTTVGRRLRPRPTIHGRLGRAAARPRVLRRGRTAGLLQRHRPGGGR